MEFLKLHFYRLQSSVQHETWTNLSLFLFRALLLFILIGERSLVIEVFSISEEIALAQGATTLDSYVVWFGDLFFWYRSFRSKTNNQRPDLFLGA